MTHYETLGIGREADRATIKKAYRRKAATTHPDRGGSSDAFHAIQKAYDTLKDDDRRAHYDATGEDENPADKIEDAALSVLDQIFDQLIDQVTSVENFDLVAAVRREIDAALDAAKGRHGKIERVAKKITTVIDRLERRVKDSFAAGPVERVLQRRKQVSDKALRDSANAVLVLERAREMLTDYAYRFDETAAPSAHDLIHQMMESVQRTQSRPYW